MDKRNTASVNWIYPVVLVVALVIFGVGIFLAVQDVSRRDWTMLAAGCIALVFVLATWPVAATLVASRDAAMGKKEEELTLLSERLQGLTVMLNEMSEQQLLSDRAKAVAYREKDRDAVRRAIREDIVKRDWEAALVLADDMERVFGYKQESMRFRDEIHKAQEEVFRKQINEGLVVIDRHCRSESWSDALREADRLMNNFRGDAQVMAIPQDIENRRQKHKQQLIDSFHDSLKRHDNDGAIEILKKLDQYLTRVEAEQMQDTVRNLFKEKLNDLKTQFALAVQDHKWGESVRIGEIITRDFPNSGIGREVREKLDTLRKRERAGDGGSVNRRRTRTALGDLTTREWQPKTLAMTPVPEGYEPVTIVPTIEAFEFRFLKPKGWQRVDVPQEQPDFNNPKLFMPLGVFVDNDTASIYSAAARPGYGDGTVLQWLQFLARENGFLAEEFAPFQLQAVQGAMVLATQPNEGGTTRLRCVAFEDGGNLFTVTAMTPVEHWEKMQPTLDLMLHSFFLRHIKGPTVPLAPEEQSTSGKTHKDFALTDDSSSLDPANEMNQRFMNNGVGMPPRVLGTNDREKYATVGASAIMAAINVPFGWHVIDDGRRTLVFDAKNEIQVNFNLLESGGKNPDEIFMEILKDLVKESPEALYNRMMLDDMPAMVVKDLVIDGEKLEQGYFLKPLAHKPGWFLKTRITTTAEHITRAGDFFEVLLRGMKFFEA